jgi:hypothetical protein
MGSCGCTGDKKTSKPFKLSKQMDEKSPKLGIKSRFKGRQAIPRRSPSKHASTEDN